MNMFKLIEWIERRCMSWEVIEEDYVEDQFCDESWTVYRKRGTVITITEERNPIESVLTCDIYRKAKQLKITLEAGQMVYCYPSIKIEKGWEPHEISDK